MMPSPISNSNKEKKNCTDGSENLIPKLLFSQTVCGDDDSVRYNNGGDGVRGSFGVQPRRQCYRAQRIPVVLLVSFLSQVPFVHCCLPVVSN